MSIKYKSLLSEFVTIHNKEHMSESDRVYAYSELSKKIEAFLLSDNKYENVKYAALAIITSILFIGLAIPH